MVVAGPAAAGDEFVCSDTGTSDTLVSSGSYNLALVYVTFPSESGGQTPDPSLPSIINTDRSVTLPTAVAKFFERQSKGALQLNFDIIERPGDATAMWLADHNHSVYSDSGAVELLDPNNSDCYPVGLGQARSPTDGELPAEILKKILAEYSPEDPFESADLIVMVYAGQAFAPTLKGAIPGGWSGLGLCGVPGLVECQGDCTGLPATREGVAFEWRSGTSTATAILILCHELGHNIKNLSGIDAGNDSHTPEKWPPTPGRRGIG